ncbi:hypothetical protein PW683_01925 [Streptomyces niveus]
MHVLAADVAVLEGLQSGLLGVGPGSRCDRVQAWHVPVQLRQGVFQQPLVVVLAGHGEVDWFADLHEAADHVVGFGEFLAQCFDSLLPFLLSVSLAR